MNNFDLLLTDSGLPSSKRDSLMAVADTMFMGRTWFQAHGYEPTPADLLKFTELVLDYEESRERIEMDMQE